MKIIIDEVRLIGCNKIWNFYIWEEVNGFIDDNPINKDFWGLHVIRFSEFYN